MHPLAVLEALKADYRRYVDSFQFYKNPAIQQWVEGKRREGRLLYREPFLTLAKPFADGGTLQDLVSGTAGQPGVLHPEVLSVFSKKPGDPSTGPIEPFAHQVQAIRQVAAGHNTTVTTGTGSGKSFTFYIPIVSEALKQRDASPAGEFRAPLAVIIYPMNALANSQYEDIAARLAGTGLTVCNYTGDLKVTEEAALEDWKELTGRDQPYDSEVIDRGSLHQRGCDILLTNFKMLEYALTRRKDGHLFQVLGDGGRLKFLVLDEMHTYSGRQGADMALLVRRFKQRTGTIGNLRCIGTSATVDSGDPVEAANVIAGFAERLFGEAFDPAHVVQEAYGTPETLDPTVGGLFLSASPVPEAVVRQAESLDDDAAVAALLAPFLLDGEPTQDAVRRCLPIAWVERALWAGVASMRDLASAYVDQVRPGVTVEEATADIEAALMLAAAVKVTGARGLPVGMLTPKAHAFFSQGLPVTRCVRSDDTGHLSEQGESTCAACAADGVDGVRSYPIVFCASCGQDYFVGAEADGLLVPRDFLGAVDGGTPVYFMTDEWDEDLVPVDPADVKRNGEARKGREGAVPVRRVVCARCGEIGDGCGHGESVDVVVVRQPMLLCPSCEVRYDGNNSEYNKFFQVGSVGRATATDVLVEGLLNHLDDDTKPQVMAFTDNQQDSSFQAAHLRSMSRRFHLRRAIMHALDGVASPMDAVDTGQVADDAFKAMEDSGTLPEFQQASGALVLGGVDQRAAARYKRYLKAGVLMEASGGARKAQPNLEDTGLIVVDYEGLTQENLIDGIAAYDRATAFLKAYAVSDPDLVYDLARALLDTVRRNRAMVSSNEAGPAAAFRQPNNFRSDVLEQIRDTAYFHGASDLPMRPIVYSETAASTKGLAVRRLAGKVNPDNSDAPQSTTLTRWLRSELGIDTADAKRLIRDMRDFLFDYGYLVNVGSAQIALNEDKVRYWRPEEPTGYRCPRCSTRWMLHSGRNCPRCVKVALVEDRPGRDDFFRAAYSAPLDSAIRVEAAEHTGSLSGDDRKTIETRFKNKDDDLNVLVCTPTMELGVDIGTLSAVYMRNVPPSPANYAQRQGRAGRAAQPSAVVTFCSAQGRSAAHDQYFFKRPEKIIAGKIAAPRFLLDNEALVVAHINALILGARDEDFPQTLPSWVALDQPNGGLLPEYRAQIDTFIAAHRADLIDAAKAAFADVLANANAITDALAADAVDAFADRLHGAMAALVDYYGQLGDELAELNAQGNAGGLDTAGRRRRDAIETIRGKIVAAEGDYYPLSWLSARGFLPTYAFPRQAVFLRFADRTTNPRVRSRSIALREFAPGNSVYHLGRRYEVTKASFGRDTHAVTEELHVCTCGWYLTKTQAAGASRCPACDTPLTEATVFAASLPVSDSFAVQRDNVGADSEERLRLGYRIVNAYRLPGTGVTHATITTPAGVTVDASYAHLGHLAQVNTGLMRSADDRFFTLCAKCRTWNPEDDHWGPDKECSPESANKISDVVIYTEGLHDMLLLDVTAPDGTDPDQYAHTLTYTLIASISTHFGVELNEIGSQVFPHPDGPNNPQGRRILLYEMDEGGIGVLDRVTTPGTWQALAAQALDILHVNPDGTDQPSACIDSCYECLRTFHNQWHHEYLDRSVVLPYLLDTAAGVTVDQVIAATDWEPVLENPASETERVMMEAIRDAGIPAPTRWHAPIPAEAPVAEADLYYEGEGLHLVVLLHGSVHEDPIVAAEDQVKEQALRDLGYSVLVIWHNRLDDGIAKLKDRLGLA